MDAPVASPEKTKPSTQSLRVLIVEDDPSYRHLCRRYLTHSSSRRVDVEEAATGDAAFRAIQRDRYDCLLVDYALPDTTGTEFIHEAGKQLGERVPPSILITAAGGEMAATEALRVGAADFLPKQVVSAETLARSIGNAVEKARLRGALNQRSEELERAIETLRARNEEIQRFYQNVSHEVKTPLAAAREFLSIVLDGVAGPVTSEQQEMLMHAVDSCDQITAHFNDLVDMTRLEAGKIQLNRRLASVEAIGIRCFAAVKAGLRAKSIRFEQAIDSPLPLVYLDRNRIMQVLGNLLGNAVKYTPEGGMVRLVIRYYAEEEQIELIVTDTGCGIARQDLPHIFDRLYQVQSSEDQFTGAGLGLGLSIAREIVLLHGGTIRAESVKGSGSSFTVRLPAAADQKLENTP